VVTVPAEIDMTNASDVTDLLAAVAVADQRVRLVPGVGAGAVPVSGLAAGAGR
jgi:hypothetical protein